MAVIQCPQCNQAVVNVLSNGLIDKHDDKNSRECLGTYRKPSELPMSFEGEDDGKIKYRYVPGLRDELHM